MLIYIISHLTFIFGRLIPLYVWEWSFSLEKLYLYIHLVIVNICKHYFQKNILIKIFANIIFKSLKLRICLVGVLRIWWMMSTHCNAADGVRRVGM